jgi:hypothetical protein
MGFVIDSELGHITHQENLERFLTEDRSAQPEWLLLKPRMGDLLDRLPLVRNHLTLRQSLRARWGVQSAFRRKPLDSVFCHTQVTAMLGLGLPAHVPLIVSLDATQRDFARLGTYHAGGKASSKRAAALKCRWAKWAFHQADALVASSAWCKRSFVQDFSFFPSVSICGDPFFRMLTATMAASTAQAVAMPGREPGRARAGESARGSAA